MRANLIYFSKSGNTAKVARVINEELEAAGYKVQVTDLAKDEAGPELIGADLVALGFPSYMWNMPEPVFKYLAGEFKRYKNQGAVVVGAPRVDGRNALIFCTYSGPHTGLNEAVPGVKNASQFFEHLGFGVLSEIYIPGEFHGMEEYSKNGPLGDLTGRPDAEDLAQVRVEVREALAEIS